MDSTCFICDTIIRPVEVDRAGTLDAIKVETPDDDDLIPFSFPKTSKPVKPTEIASSDHLNLMQKLLGLSNTCLYILKTDLPHAGRMFCLDCTSILQMGSEIFDQIQQLQEKVDGLKEQVEEQLSRCVCSRLRPRRSPKARTVQRLREQIVQDIQKSTVQSHVPQHTNTSSFDELDSDNCHDMPMDSESDSRDPLESSDDFRKSGLGLRDCIVDLSDVNMGISSYARSQNIQAPCPSKRRRKSATSKEGKRKSTKCHSDIKPSRGKRWGTALEAETMNEDDSAQHTTEFEKNPASKVKQVKRKRGPAKFSCPECPAIFTSETRLNYHKLNKHQLTEYTEICSNCGKRFIAKSALITHIKVQGGSCKKAPVPEKVTVIRAAGPYQFQCDICGLKVQSRTRIDNHMASHTKIKRWTCDICGRSLSASMSLKSHKLSLHPELVPDSEHPYKCSYEGCGKAYGTSAGLDYHTKTAHLKKFDFLCGECGFKAPTAASLRIHNEVMHLGLRKYKCKICGLAQKRNGLKKHMLSIHTAPEDRPYKCGTCEKTFADGFNLRQHEFLHTGEKAIQCSMCPKRFATKNYLQIHVKHVHKIREPIAATEEEGNIAEDMNNVKFDNSPMVELESNQIETALVETVFP